MPDLGFDLEYVFTKGIGVVARLIVTFGGTNRTWTASIGASIPLG